MYVFFLKNLYKKKLYKNFVLVIEAFIRNIYFYFYYL